MDLKGIMLSEISQLEKDKYYRISLMWNIKNKQNKINEQIKPNKNKHEDTENRVVVTRGEGVVSGRVKGINCMVTDGNEIFGGEHTVEYTEVEI